jgi:hypothetical protein
VVLIFGAAHYRGSVHALHKLIYVINKQRWRERERESRGGQKAMKRRRYEEEGGNGAYLLSFHFELLLDSKVLLVQNQHLPIVEADQYVKEVRLRADVN